MTARCYVCDAPVTPETDDQRRNPLCPDHRAARAHVPSMTLDADRAAVATCRCGWSHRDPERDGAAMDEAVRAHWRDVCEAEGGA